MKKFRPYTLFVLFTVTVSTGFYACKKYEDGPALSLRSRAARLAGTWGVENIKKNGDDITSIYSDFRETYTKSGDYSYNWSGISGAGKWTFQKNDEEILVDMSGQADHTNVIQKLKDDQLWYYYMDGNDKYEFHMVPR
jgi:hypothetical protein